MVLGNQRKLGDSFVLRLSKLVHKKYVHIAQRQSKSRVWLHFQDPDFYEYSQSYGQNCLQMTWFILLSITFNWISSSYSSIETNHLGLMKAFFWFFDRAKFWGWNIVLFCRHQEMKNPSVLMTLTAKKFCLLGRFLLLLVLSDMLLKSSVFHSSSGGKSWVSPKVF